MREILAILLLLTTLLPSAAQQAGGNAIPERLESQVDAFTQETIYVHTDTDEYRAGGRIWLKVYLVDAIQLINLDGSRYVYVEWINPDGDIVKRIKIKERDGLYAGYLDIPEDSGPGLYTLRAYTRYMSQYGNGVCKTVQVGRPRHLTTVDSQADTTSSLFLRFQDGTVTLSTTLPERHYLVGLCRKEVFFLGGLSSARPLSFDGRALPGGLLEFLLFDRDLLLTAKASCTIRNGDRALPVGLTSDQAAYRTGDEIGLQLDVSALEEGEIADLSLSVTRRIFPALTSIREELLYRNEGPAYDLAQVLQGEYTTAPGPQETTQVLSGEVRTLFRNRPVEGATVSLISPQAGMFDITKSDADGRFTFSGLDYPEGTHYIIKSTDEKGADRYSLIINDMQWPDLAPPEVRWIPGEPVSDIVYGDADADAVELAGSTVTASYVDPEIQGFSKLADFSFGPGQLEEMRANSLLEVLRRAPGVFFRTVPDPENTALMSEKVYLRANVSIMNDVPAAIAIDGIILDEDYDLNQIEMPNVERVDIFKTGQAVIWGTRAGGGLISITTKKGDFDPGKAADKENLRKATPLGYQRQLRFTPSGTTLYWEPSIQSRKISFPAGTVPGTYTVTLEGVTSRGRLVHEEILLQINRP